MATPTGADNGANHSKLEEVFETMMQEIYWSEQNLLTVLGTMGQAATTKELKQSFADHLTQTKTHVSRLEEAFTMMSMQAQPEPSVGLQGLIDEGNQAIDETDQGSAQRDVALIVAAQKVEHYEMACYGSLVTLARTIGRTDVAELLGETLTEEKETDALLTQIAEGKINYRASQEPVSQ